MMKPTSRLKRGNALLAVSLLVASAFAGPEIRPAAPVRSTVGADITLTADNNKINSTFNKGLYLHSYSTSSVTFTLEDKTSSGAGNHGIRAESENQSVLNLTALNNLITVPSTLTVNDTIKDIVTGSVNELSLDSAGNPTGTVILDGDSLLLLQDAAP